MDVIDEILTRGVANIIPNRESLEQKLRSNQKLNIYCGFDVTSSHLHIGNAVNLRKLQQFVKLGHHVTFLIGDFTTLIGDTSDKESERPIISENEIAKNWQKFSEQAGKILDVTKISVRRNSEWLDGLSSRELIRLIQRFSLNDFVSRELIRKRMNSGGSVNLAEAIYPVLQGFDSYFLDTDLQIGATDQTFNMQAGRHLIKQLKNKESFIMTFNFLAGTDGRKMSKSWGNAIWLDDPPAEIYGKVMSINDDLIQEYFMLATSLPQSQFPGADIHPMQAKKRLAYQIVLELNGKPAAEQAQTYFESTFQQGKTPQNLRRVKVINPNLIETLIETRLAASKSEAKRLIEQGAVKVNGVKVLEIEFQVANEDILQVGPRKFAKIDL